ncbi:hypothetical protein HZA85_02635 [Candidatus Uhrbacteria bacterium]|nr:hypothetical protein [Candidatus Uhrbacteria bacterium]
MTSIIRLGKPNANRYRRVKLDTKNLPDVTVLVPARNEPLGVLEATFICLFSLDYPKKDIYFLDGSDPKFQEKNGELAQKYNIHHFVPEQKVFSPQMKFLRITF